jgi:hypothetical protein
MMHAPFLVKERCENLMLNFKEFIMHEIKPFNKNIALINQLSRQIYEHIEVHLLRSIN